MKNLFHAGNVILFGFGGMIVFMSYLVYQCILNPSVMVGDNYYQKELKYQEVIDAKNNTIPFSDSLILTKQNSSIIIQIPFSINHAMTKASLLAYNQADDKKDKSIDLAQNASGIYTIDTKSWGNGNYALKLSVQSGNRDYYMEFKY